MTAAMVRVLACIALLFFLVPVSGLHIQRTIPSTSQQITVTPFTFAQDLPSENKFGELTFISGWELGSANSDFGGISALVVKDDGRFLALSDAGMLFGFSLPDSDAAPNRSFIAPLPGSAGKDAPIERRDAESMVYDSRTGRSWIGFEDSNAIIRYGPAFAREEKAVRPDAMKQWPGNGGAEAMLRLSGGRFIVLAEEAFGPGNSTDALLYSGDPAASESPPIRFGYKAPQGYRVTDAAPLPDGRVIMTNRRATILGGFSIIVTIADPADISAGKIWEGRPIASFSSPYGADNIEAVAITETDDGIFVWLASDDNFQSFQRSLLLQFRLDERD